MKYKSIVWIVGLVVFQNLRVQAQTETYTWHNVAMGGGGFVSGLITSRTEQDLLYARTDVGGAYRWNATEKNWVPLLDWVNESKLGYLGVESIAIDPVETNKLYMLVGTSYFNNGASAILRSDDYGNTFSITDVTSQFKAHGNGMGRQTGEKLVVDPNKPEILFCGSRANGLFKSSTSGATWTKVNSLNISTTPNGNGICFVVMDPSSSSSGNETQTIIVGVSRSGSDNMYRSDNGGTTFTPIVNAPSSLMPHRATLASNGNLYITYVNNAGPWDITGAGAILKYNLTTGVWSNVTPSGFAGAFGGISVDPNNSSRLVASSINSYLSQDNSWGDRIFLSTNGGSSWTDVVAQGFDLDPNGSPWIEGQAIHWAGSIEFDPFDTKKAWVISGNGIFQTDNIDATTNVWKFQVSGLEETVPLDIVSIANGPLLTAIGDYDGFRHYDVTQYAPIHTPRMGTTTGIASASLNKNIVVRVGQRTSGASTTGLLYYSSNNGVTWEEHVASGLSGKLAVSADGATILHSPEGSNKCYWSEDEGKTWTTVIGLSISSGVPVADPLDPKSFYAYNNSTGMLMVSHDKGASFVASGTPGSGGSKIMRVAPYRKGDIWVPLNNGGLSRSINGGESFTKITNVNTCNAVGFGKASVGESSPTVFIWGNVGGVVGIYRSTDEGLTWIRVNDNEHEYGGLANGQFVIGDMNAFGRVYMSTAGRGVVYGESSEACIPTMIEAHVNVNGGEDEASSFVTVDEGADVLLSPIASGGGIWKWNGPDGFTTGDREITLSNIQSSQGGIYSVTYENAQGCISAPQLFSINVPKYIEEITVDGVDQVTTISQKNGTLQLRVTITPSDATDQSISWSITEGDELASLSSTGLLTAIADGVVTVRATANDGSGIYDEIDITISNQLVTGIEHQLSTVNFFPNPVNSSLIITQASRIIQFNFIDVCGRTILKVKNENDVLLVDTSSWPQGIYIVQCISNEYQSFSRRIVKK